MYCKTLTYTDFLGTERTEDFYFNFTTVELQELQTSVPGGLKGHIDKILAAKDAEEIAAVFKDLLLKSYGELSPDGRRFMKSKEITEGFVQTQAYSDYYMLLASDDEEAAKFITGIIPQKLMEEVEKENPELLENIKGE